MGAWLDRFEQLILNYSRRIITILFIISTIVALVSLIVSTAKFFDSPDISEEDSFSVPRFKKPVNQTPTNTNNIDSEKNKEVEEPKVQEKKIEEAHPMPKYKSQISQITEYVYPLYVAFYKWDTSSLANFDGKIQITNVIANNLKPFDNRLNKKQMDGVVDGLVEYIKDFSNYYMRQFNINSNIDEIRPRNDEEFEKILRNPYRNYLDEVRANYEELLNYVDEELVAVEENRESAKSIILVTGIAASAMLTLILLLLIFKAENSLRRHANSSERKPINKE